jgi:putative ABC transport system permease protein
MRRESLLSINPSRGGWDWAIIPSANDSAVRPLQTRRELSVEVVGLVRDTKYEKLSEAFRPIAFLSIDQETADPDAMFVIRSAAPLSDLIAQARAVITGTNRDITTDFRSFASTVAEGLTRERLLATLSDFFGALATLIAALGLYGVMSYLVARRTNEIGVRVALGARSRDILSLILRQSAALLAVGLGAGTLLALALGRSVSSLLFGLQPNDSGTIAIAALLLAVVTQTASYLPARRASRLEPMAALREE